MKIAIAGHTGLIGTYLKKKFTGHTIVPIERSDLYNNDAGLYNKIKEANIVINLAGASISMRWTKKNKDEIMRSRVISTRNIVQTINSLPDNQQPKYFFNASGIGIYDDINEHSEDSENYGNGFVTKVVINWENEARSVNKKVKLVIMRFGIVLSRSGGALIPIRRLYNAFIGGPIGPGNQPFSFIHLKDIFDGIQHILDSNQEGTFNFSSPNYVEYKVFAKSIARVLKRPNLFYVPSFVLKILMGDRSQILTKGQRVLPKRLLESGYIFNFADINDALKDIYSN